MAAPARMWWCCARPRACWTRWQSQRCGSGPDGRLAGGVYTTAAAGGCGGTQPAQFGAPLPFSQSGARAAIAAAGCCTLEPLPRRLPPAGGAQRRQTCRGLRRRRRRGCPPAWAAAPTSCQRRWRRGRARPWRRRRCSLMCCAPSQPRSGRASRSVWCTRTARCWPAPTAWRSRAQRWAPGWCRGCAPGWRVGRLDRRAALPGRVAKPARPHRTPRCPPRLLLRTQVVTGTSAVPSFTDVPPSKKSGSSLQYGPYQDTQPFTLKPISGVPRSSRLAQAPAPLPPQLVSWRSSPAPCAPSLALHPHMPHPCTPPRSAL